MYEIIWCNIRSNNLPWKNPYVSIHMYFPYVNMLVNMIDDIKQWTEIWSLKFSLSAYTSTRGNIVIRKSDLSDGNLAVRTSIIFFEVRIPNTCFERNIFKIYYKTVIFFTKG